ncbi:DUF885 domain-containing protein [Nitrospirillum viridazoti]|uniref:Uncharacterized protein (DUF885 family) n=1 Tax=Nitrospirillum amazonense TaxID=28077 RepID=A0A560IUP0_9PROT|nr:DUF885 family protein [Nitrospirillum amazonense]TWB62281.1 uncharacterized protein (DUF885 family) [Nitrospirillum amazonense]
MYRLPSRRLAARLLVGTALFAGVLTLGQIAGGQITAIGPVFGVAHAAAAGKADAQFKAIYTKEWKWRQEEFKGEDDEDSTDTVAGHLPKVDAATQEKRQKVWEGVLKDLAAVPQAELSPEAQVDFSIYRDQVTVLLNSQKFKDYEKPLNADSSFWSNMAGGARKPFHTVAEYKSFIGQLNDMPRYFGEQIVNMRAGLKRGFTPPKVTLTGRDSGIVNVVEAKTPEDNVYYTPFKTMPDTIPAATQAELRAAAVAAITKSVVPAHQSLLKFMREEYIPGARTELAAESLPDGKAYYQSKIKEFATVDLTADQIHKIGLEEVAKIHAQMLDVMKQANFQGDFPAFLKFLRTDPQFYAKTPEELLMRAAWIAKKFDGKADQYFGYLPRSRFAIIPVPADIAPFYTSGRGGPGVYLVNTYDLPSRGLYALPALTLHESAPGHAFQMPIAAEQKDQPEFRQKVYISAFGEGWALYCEKLGDEMGMYETPYERFGMLSYQMWRAARLVVDTGIHAKGWTREQAQQYLHDNTALADHEIETEVDRYIAWPGQALSYYLGEMAILKARAKAEKALGQKFDLRNFHDTVLKLGGVPLPVLEARIDRFIAEGGKSPYPAQ